MIAEETYELLRMGEKVTCDKLPENIYVYYNKETGKLYRSDESSMAFGFGDIDYDGWEIYEEPKKEHPLLGSLTSIVESLSEKINMEEQINHLAYELGKVICNKAPLKQFNDLLLTVHLLEERIRLLEKK